VLAIPLVLLAGWVGIALVIRAIEPYKRGPGEAPDVEERAAGSDDTRA
jgi:hypothetical protein